MIVIALAILWSATLSATASANEGKPIYKDAAPSDSVGEVAGIPTVTIQEERLNFDFRPLASGGVPHVTATYTLVNDGDALSTPLVFASFDIDGGTVQFDEANVASRPLASGELPIAWETADGPAESVTHGKDGASGLAFEIEISPGQHTLAVDYDIAGQWEWTPGGAVVRYALAPARSWKALDSLHIDILCPPDMWCSPLEVDGKSDAYSNAWGANERGWSAHYTEIPTDLVTIRVTQAEPTWLWLAGYGIVLLGLILAISAVWVGGRFLASIDVFGKRVLAWLVVAPLVQVSACGHGLGWSKLAQYRARMTGGYDGLSYLLLSGAVGVLVAAAAVPIAAAIMRRGRAR